MARLVWENHTRGRGRDREEWDPDLDPAPTILAGGINGCCHSHYRLEPGEATVTRRPAPDKPPYRVPDVATIRDEHAGTNGLVAVSTFAGAGGSSTGYRWAGFDVRWASEYMDAAADSYEANWPGCTVDRRDVRGVTGREVLEAVGVGPGELDLLDGSPPCQPFSLSGRRERNWGREVAHGDGTTNAGGSEDLMVEWVRLVGETRPRAAVMENVKGLTIGKAKGHLIRAVDQVRDLGYRVGVRLLDAQWLGVPQRRVRVFVVAVREDLGIDPPFPDPLPYRYTMADACPWLSNHALELDPHGYFPGSRQHADEEPAPTIAAAGMGSHGYRVKVVDRQLGSGFVPADIDPDADPASTIVASGADQFRVHGPPPPEGDGPSIVGTCLEGEYERLMPGEQSDRYYQLVRPRADQPVPTLVASTGSSPGVAGVVHPWEPRKFTIAEARRLCGFPDDYLLTGGYRDQWARLGNSVPPPVAMRVGTAIAAALADAP